jgi:hypothetical protein
MTLTEARAIVGDEPEWVLRKMLRTDKDEAARVAPTKAGWLRDVEYRYVHCTHEGQYAIKYRPILEGLLP